MMKHQTNLQGGTKLAALDPIWDRVRTEAEDIVRREPELASFIYSTVLHHDRLEQAVVHRIAERLDHSALSGDLIRQTYDEALRDDPDLGNAFRADLVAVYDRDPATARFIDPLLYFKGFHALQTHRLAHWLYQKGRKDFAFYLQSRSSAVFQTDINPAARIGRGISAEQLEQEPSLFSIITIIDPIRCSGRASAQRGTPCRAPVRASASRAGILRRGSPRRRVAPSEDRRFP